MPHHPPLCPAFTHAQSLTLSPIQETVYSPLHPHENAVFADFSWAGVFSPVSRGTSPMLGSDGSKSPSSPGMLLSRLDQLTLQYSKIAPKAAAVPHTGVGLGFDLEIKLSNRVLADLPIGKERRHSSISTYTPSAPANTPTAVRNRRRYSSFLSREPVYNYEEDDVDPLQLAREVSESDEADLLPMMGWLQNRLEEAARREEYESDVDAIELDMPESSTLADIQTAVVTERKVVKVDVHRAVASLRRTESVLQTPPRSSAKVDEDTVGDDRESPRNSIFSPPVVVPRRTSIILNARTVSQATAGPPSITNLHKQHKRKASTVSERSFLSSASGKNKKVRRSSMSTLSNVSNALSPIFSSAFMKTLEDDEGKVDEFGRNTNQMDGKGKRGLQRTISFFGGRV